MAEGGRTSVTTERGKDMLVDAEGYSYTYHVPLTRGDVTREKNAKEESMWSTEKFICGQRKRLK